jgi:dTDP-4-dehydrorhamnose 3,5-epimerase
MQIQNLIGGAKLLTFARHSDSRGWFAESWSNNWMDEYGIAKSFVQSNTVQTRLKHTIRGLHTQIPPHQTSKLLQVIRGAVIDVFVDARSESDSYGKWSTVTLTEDTAQLIYVPGGFYHGYMTLVDDTIVHYQQDEFYSAESDYGLLWNDPTINIEWGLNGELPIVSDKDTAQPIWELAKKF